MQITCKKCGSEVPAANVDLQRNIAKCVACNCLFSCRAQLNALGSGMPEEGPASTRRDVPMPKGTLVFRKPNSLTITCRWFGAKALGMLLFCCVWDGFLVFWFTAAITEKRWEMAAFGTIHALIGVGVTYLAVAMLVNTTTILAQRGLLQVTHGPLPAPGQHRLETSHLLQLYSLRHVTHHKNRESISYELHALVRGGRDVKLVSGLDTEEQALFMEQQVEGFLGIADRPVDGEVRR